MRRDMDLVRDLLLMLENWKPDDSGPIPKMAGHGDRETLHHVLLMQEAGLLDGLKITWSGYEFLNLSRNPATWSRAKSWIQERGEGLSFKALKLVLAHLCESALCPGQSRHGGYSRALGYGWRTFFVLPLRG